ncbi:hypothetical protein [Lawsonibacter hominis]|uniref:Uncharacterized protein n=1 Tax=Lawsonibacter hominis TaxID=2763053 RepID=A0A8J6JES0_9FIRM|nr:hypothetical protein [Lawsonibacter hominis]MBC5733962.1 hypothetical protein [Lawsonibacter hominis]
MSAIEKLGAQQSQVPARSAPWMVAEQLMDICRREPECAELIAQDLDNPDMSIVEAEKQIKAFADSHRTGKFSCVTPSEADRILREFYGLPEAGMGAEAPGVIGLDLADFLG